MRMLWDATYAHSLYSMQETHVARWRMRMAWRSCAISHVPQISARARTAKRRVSGFLCSVTCFTGAIAQRTSW